MDDEAAFRDLFAYLRRTAGGSLRSVVRYDAEGYRVLYGADALSTYSEEEMETFVRDRREEHGEEFRRERIYDVGALDSPLRLFDDAVILHLVGDDGVGVVVSLYPRAASALSEFVRGCHERLAGCPAFDAAADPDGSPRSE